MTQPFATWQRAVDAAMPGDTILLQPGTYRVSGPQDFGVRIRRSGTSAQPITLRGNGGRAVLDCRGLQSDWGAYCLHIRANWWRISDVDVTGTRQARRGSWVIGVAMENSSDNVLERITSRDHQGPGIVVTGASARNRLQNCDAHNNYDPLASPPGGNADGIQLVNIARTATGNRIIGCRAWANSDDGYDLWQAESVVTIEGSWAFRNGYVPGTTTPAGNGTGFKLGRNSSAPSHRVVRNAAFHNRVAGFDSNSAAGGLDVANNVAYENGQYNYVFYGSSSFRLRNNVGYHSGGGTRNYLENSAQTANSWNLFQRLASSDFASLSPGGVDGPRRADGSLPSNGFLRPNTCSRLIDRGVPVGMGYTGRAPDLGAFESASSCSGQ